MAIDINSLFADIIDTPEQRQQKLLQQGMKQGELLASGLRGRAAALAPLAQMAGQLGVQRQENLRRAVQPMLGIDPRTTGEKMAEQLQNLDPENPDSLLQAAQALQSIDPLRAVALRQAAAQKRIEQQDRERTTRLQELQLSAAEREEALAEQAEENKATTVARFAAMGVPDAFIESYKNGELTARDLMTSWAEQLSAKAKVKPFKFESLKGEDKDIAIQAIIESEEAQELFKEVQKGTESRYFGIAMPWGGEKVYNQQSLLDEAAVWRVLNPDMTVTEAVKAAVTSLPNGGARSVLASGGQGADLQMQRSVNIARGNLPAVSPANINLGQQSEQAGLNLAGFESEVNSIFEEASALQNRIESSEAGATDVMPTSTQPVPYTENPSMVVQAMLGMREVSKKLFNSGDDQTKTNAQDQGVSASQYLKAVEGLDFPVVSSLSRNIPVVQKAAIDAFNVLKTTFSSVDNIKKVRDAGIDSLLGSTANLVGTLVEGQASSRRQGEQIATNIDLAKQNIKEMRSKIGQLPPPSRRIVVEQLNNLENIVLERAAQLAGQVFD
jgi:hypothetical protein